MKPMRVAVYGWILGTMGWPPNGSVGAACAETNPFPCGQCTAVAYGYWVDVFGQTGPPSFRAARYWYDDAPVFGFSRGRQARPQSLLVLDAWPKHSMGHVAVVWQRIPGWYGDWELLWLVLGNWSPRTDGICGAPPRSDWFAYNPQTRTVKYWNGASWSQHYPVKGFVYPKPAAALAGRSAEATGRRRG